MNIVNIMHEAWIEYVFVSISIIWQLYFQQNVEIDVVHTLDIL